MRIDVLGTVRARHDDGRPVALGGPRHREVLARLVAAEGRMVGTDTLVDDLWPDPPARAVGALRTFVAALRRALEPDRPPRHPPRLLVTEGPGYALRLPRTAVDVHRFEDTLAAARRDPAAPGAAAALTTALATWRGPAYADVPASPWAERERARLKELRLEAVELRARILLDSPPDPAHPDGSVPTAATPGPRGPRADLAGAGPATGDEPGPDGAGGEAAGAPAADDGTASAATDSGAVDGTAAAGSAKGTEAAADASANSGTTGGAPADSTATGTRAKGNEAADGGAANSSAADGAPAGGISAGTSTTGNKAAASTPTNSSTADGAPADSTATGTRAKGNEAADGGAANGTAVGTGTADSAAMQGPPSGGGSAVADGGPGGGGDGVDAGGSGAEGFGGLVAELGAHVDAHPWREPAWGLLARALHRAGRQADALATLRRARAMLADRLGLDPGPELRRVEAEILGADAAAGWTAPGVRLGPRTTVDLARTLAFAGGDALVHSRRDRLAAIRAAERTGDPGLTARVVGAYDVPALWSRADDPGQSRAVVAAAERTLAALGPAAPATVRARLLATVAVESRSADLTAAERERAGRAARQAEALARESADPALLAFALNGTFLQSFTRPGLAGLRDGIGAEILGLAERHELPGFAVLGRLVRLQSASALGDLDAAAGHAEAAERLAALTEAPLVPVLTGWFRARAAAARSTAPDGPSPAAAAARYREAEGALRTAGMPGLHRGLFALALLGLRLLHDRPAPTDPRLDWGPYLPWARPLVLLARGRADQARTALGALPEPPRDHLQEALWCLTAHAAVLLGERGTAARAATALRGARAEDAGAASGLLTLGPVARYLAEAEAA
ncbi:BTAD domain-containing putative transcriptional regulator [Streptomyces sp. NPDC021020]|uniref:BTAD domain-containing putative transcriptional regulator n=1 Tax=Streptomyces sp. NPDC021020 TaxID=3365109 RepID=UPI0037ABA28B